MPPIYLNRLEAAELSGLAPAAVKNAIDRAIVPATTIDDRSLIEARDVAALVMLPLLGSLANDQKRRVRDWLRNDRRSRRLPLNAGLSVERVPDAERAADEAERYARLRERWIVSNPAVRGGDPVLRGSRVSVHTLADRIAAGESAEVLDEDLPHVPSEAREVAARYARANPRRGRPRRRGRPA